MAGPAFQFIDTVFDDGEYGTSYGDTSYGGPYGEPFVLPDLQYPSDDLQDSNHKITGEIVHKRHGIILGRRKWAQVRRWHCAFRALDGDVLDLFVPYYDIRRFLLLPYGENTSPEIIVNWVQAEWKPKPLRGGYFDLTFDLEEALS